MSEYCLTVHLELAKAMPLLIHQQDGCTGFYFVCCRYHDVSLGRWREPCRNVLQIRELTHGWWREARSFWLSLDNQENILINGGGCLCNAITLSVTDLNIIMLSDTSKCLYFQSDDVYLEAQIQNTTHLPMVMEKVCLEPSELYTAFEVNTVDKITRYVYWYFLTVRMTSLFLKFSVNLRSIRYRIWTRTIPVNISIACVRNRDCQLSRTAVLPILGN